MRVATALYDQHDTLVMPSRLYEYVPNSNEISVEAGFWHKFQNNYRTPEAFLIALDHFEKSMAQFGGIPITGECGAFADRFDRTFWRLSMLYIIEEAHRLPFYRRPGETIDPNYVEPFDPTAFVGSWVPAIPGGVDDLAEAQRIVRAGIADRKAAAEREETRRAQEEYERKRLEDLANYEGDTFMGLKLEPLPPPKRRWWK